MKNLSLLIVIGLLAAGCSSIGNAPEGMSAEQAKAAVQSLPIDEQIKLVENSPMDPRAKAARIAELKAQAGNK